MDIMSVFSVKLMRIQSLACMDCSTSIGCMLHVVNPYRNYLHVA